MSKEDRTVTPVQMGEQVFDVKVTLKVKLPESLRLTADDIATYLQNHYAMAVSLGQITIDGVTERK